MSLGYVRSFSEYVHPDGVLAKGSTEKIGVKIGVLRCVRLALLWLTLRDVSSRSRGLSRERLLALNSR